MGNCSSNILDSHQQSTNLFEVYNVDARLFEHSKGQIKITSNQMILIQKRLSNDLNNLDQKQIIWPLNGIRRYGHYKDIFLFESGRKCSTGEGLFAFKCDRAKRLSNRLHKAILQNASVLCNLQPNNNQIPTRREVFSFNDQVSSISSLNTNSRNLENTSTSLSSEMNLNNNSTDLSFNEIPQTPTLETGLNKTALSPYYVNDLKSLVKLPASLSFVNTENSKITSSNLLPSDYVNSEMIDPSLLFLAKKINHSNVNTNTNENERNYHHQNTKKKNYEKLKDLFSSSSSSKLIYVTPDFSGGLNKHETGESVKRITNNHKNALEFSNTYREIEFQSSKEFENITDYVTIDAKKTQVIKASASPIK